MKRIILVVAICLGAVSAKTQRVYFIYLQTENFQPFHARIDEKVYTSNASGYLILPKLRDTIYTLHIGFPSGGDAEKTFKIPIQRRDHGFLLKNFGEKGWALFNLQTLAVMMPVADQSTAGVRMERRESNPFTDLLAKAADDSTLKVKPILVKQEEKRPVEPVVIVRKEEPKQEESKPVETKPVETKIVKTEPPKSEPVKEDKKITEPVIAKNEEKPVTIIPENKPEEKKTEEKKPDEIKQVIPAATDEPVKTEKEEDYQPSRVQRRSESSTTEGFGLTFVDIYPDGQMDTIRILIPNPAQNLLAKENVPEPVKEEKKFVELEPVDTTEKIPVKEESKQVIDPVKKEVTKIPEVKEEPKHQQVDQQLKELNKETEIKEEPKRPVAVLTKKNNCKEVAKESDFLRLRKRMAAAHGDEQMISEAKKVFKTQCFTTEQVRNLSALFLRDEGKYKFFDTAYSHVSDAENYGSLESEMKEEYFINRFRAMLY